MFAWNLPLFFVEEMGGYVCEWFAAPEEWFYPDSAAPYGFARHVVG